MARKIPTFLILSWVTLVFFLFPYTEVVPISSYTQPYALALAILLVSLRPSAIRSLPQLDRLMLLSLAALGLLLLVFEVPAGIDFREIAFVLSYVTPLFSTAAAYWIVRRYPDMARKMLIVAIVIWTGVSLIQTLVSPTFLTQFVTRNLELAGNIRASGRGALGLAPEPTHNAFHSLLLGATLVIAGGPAWAVALALFNSLFLAKSASAVLALAIGGVLWTLRRFVRRFWMYFSLIALPGMISSLVELFEDTRIGLIFSRLESLDLSIIMLDYSVNARISGAVMPIYYQFREFLVPQGISLQRWLDVRTNILSENSWIIDLSSAGPASGIGLFLFQGGLLAVPLTLYLVSRVILQMGKAGLAGYASATVFAVFCAQYYFSTPMFGLFLAFLIHRLRSPLMKTQVNYPEPASLRPERFPARDTRDGAAFPIPASPQPVPSLARTRTD